MAWEIEKFLPEDVLKLCGFDPSNQKSDWIRFRCPFCGSKTSNTNMAVKMSEGYAHCFACDYRGNVIQLYKDMLGISSYKASFKQILSDLNLTSLSNDQYVRRAAQVREKINSYKANTVGRTNIDEINAAYTGLLSGLRLNDEHHMELLGRGMEEEMIIRNQYKSSITTHEDAEIYTRLLLKQGLNVEGVPGFYTNYNGDWSFARSYPGIYIPYRNIHNKIFGMQIRVDDDFLKLSPEGKAQRYYWNSSFKYEKGCKAENSVHFACDYSWDRGTNQYLPVILDFNGKRAFGFTEGALKADIFFSLTAFPTIAIAGVNSIEPIRKAIMQLKAMSVEVIYNFIDMDSYENINVAKALKKITAIIEECGMVCVRPNWDRSLNGIDDFYAYKLKGILPKRRKQ